MIPASSLGLSTAHSTLPDGRPAFPVLVGAYQPGTAWAGSRLIPFIRLLRLGAGQGACCWHGVAGLCVIPSSSFIRFLRELLVPAARRPRSRESRNILEACREPRRCGALRRRCCAGGGRRKGRLAESDEDSTARAAREAHVAELCITLHYTTITLHYTTITIHYTRSPCRRATLRPPWGVGRLTVTRRAYTPEERRSRSVVIHDRGPFGPN